MRCGKRNKKDDFLGEEMGLLLLFEGQIDVSNVEHDLLVLQNQSGCPGFVVIPCVHSGNITQIHVKKKGAQDNRF